MNTETKHILHLDLDTFFVSVTATYDLIQNESGVSFNIYPAWLGQGLSTGQLNDVFGAQRR